MRPPIHPALVSASLFLLAGACADSPVTEAGTEYRAVWSDDDSAVGVMRLDYQSDGETRSDLVATLFLVDPATEQEAGAGLAYELPADPESFYLMKRAGYFLIGALRVDLDGGRAYVRPGVPSPDGLTIASFEEGQVIVTDAFDGDGELARAAIASARPSLAWEAGGAAVLALAGDRAWRVDMGGQVQPVAYPPCEGPATSSSEVSESGLYVSVDQDGAIELASASADVFGCIAPPDGPDGPRQITGRPDADS